MFLARKGGKILTRLFLKLTCSIFVLILALELCIRFANFAYPKTEHQPYFNEVFKKAGRPQLKVKVNARGARGNLTHIKPKQFAVFGTSVAYGMELKNQESWPHILGEMLGVDVDNYANRYMTTHRIRQIAESIYSQGWRYDVAIVAINFDPIPEDEILDFPPSYSKRWQYDYHQINILKKLNEKFKRALKNENLLSPALSYFSTSAHAQDNATVTPALKISTPLIFADDARRPTDGIEFDRELRKQRVAENLMVDNYKFTIEDEISHHGDVLQSNTLNLKKSLCKIAKTIVIVPEVISYHPDFFDSFYDHTWLISYPSHRDNSVYFNPTAMAKFWGNYQQITVDYALKNNMYSWNPQREFIETISLDPDKYFLDEFHFKAPGAAQYAKVIYEKIKVLNSQNCP